MTDSEKQQVQQETRRQTLNDCAMIAALESHYWALNKDPRPHMRDFSMGAMGASANICTAIFMGRSVAEVEAEIVKRD